MTLLNPLVEQRVREIVREQMASWQARPLPNGKETGLRVVFLMSDVKPAPPPVGSIGDWSDAPIQGDGPVWMAIGPCDSRGLPVTTWEEPTLAFPPALHGRSSRPEYRPSRKVQRGRR